MANLPTILAIMGAVWIGNKLKQLWDGFTSLSVKIGQKILENGKSIWNGIKGFASKAASGIKSAFSKVAPKISNGIKTLVTGVKNTVSKVVTPLKNLGGKVAAGISKLGQTGVGKAVGKIASKVGGFAAKTGKVFGKENSKTYIYCEKKLTHLFVLSKRILEEYKLLYPNNEIELITIYKHKS